jgi:hypothetical protein
VPAEGSKQQLLLGLPFTALEALLSDDRTRVTSESTVFYTIKRWHKQRQRLGFASEAALKVLLRLIRMQHCGQLGVLAISHSEVAQVLFSWEELMFASCLATDGSTGSITAASQSLVLGKYPAWKAPKRPASTVKELIGRCRW